MTDKKIIEENKLIAEFMEYEQEDKDSNFITDHLVCLKEEYWNSTEDDWTNSLSPSEMKFHSSWDWLMPVVDKIEEISFTDDNIKSEYVPYTKHPFTIDMSYNYAKVKVDNDFKIENLREDGINFKIHRGSKINACYEAVVEFIKWYNKLNV